MLRVSVEVQCSATGEKSQLGMSRHDLQLLPKDLNPWGFADKIYQTEDLEIVHLSIDPGKTIPLHYHPEIRGLFFMLCVYY